MAYLTENLKSYYQQDLEEAVIPLLDDFWRFDEELHDLIDLINSHDGLQTIYSRAYSPERSGLDLDPTSYIKVAFAQDKRMFLGALLMQVYDGVNGEYSPVTLSEEAPQENRNYTPDSAIHIGCLTNPDYFRVWHFHLSLRSEDIDAHTKFWSLLEKAFRMDKSNSN